MDDTPPTKPAPSAPNRKPRAASPGNRNAPEETPNLLSPKAFWTLVIVGIGLIVWMIGAAPKQKKLVCDVAPTTSLIELGRCRTE